MTRPGIDRRVFVVGVARSGTTLVQSLLAAHSTMTSFTESHFFDRHFTRLPGLPGPILTRDPRSRVHEFLVENGETSGESNWFEARARWALGLRPLLPFQTRPVAQHRFEKPARFLIASSQMQGFDQPEGTHIECGFRQAEIVL